MKRQVATIDKPVAATDSFMQTRGRSILMAVLLGGTIGICGYYIYKLITGKGGNPADGPEFPAPGSPGDGQQWMYVVYLDKSAAWYELMNFSNLMANPDMAGLVDVYYGPFDSGANG